ncbi:MAG: hypothetical protein NC205_04740 [Prevotella sp.]|nr:hypothetical protein [Alistipes senegalensis]MCM1357880.1 hypothetical protein [Prevotella sp.]MCM1473904.1 hypothetical protein [Muribaculaceae bacterium]
MKESHFKNRSPIKSKDFANRAVRKSKEIPTGKGDYRKIYDSYMISDYRFITVPDEKEFKRQWKNNNSFQIGYSRIKHSNDYQKDLYR